MSPASFTAPSNSAASAGDALLRIRGLVKHFGATRALDGVDFDLAAGEIVALMGANGAGKSTTVNILAGALDADSGNIELNGAAYRPSRPADAVHAGIVTVHQSTERIGAAGMPVADALLLDRFATGSFPFFLSKGSVRRQAAEIARDAGFPLDLDADFGDLRPADRQLVAIARALSSQARILILDEPTASLSQSEAERLFEVLRRLKARGLAILYISHRIADLTAIADRAMVFRGGRVVADFVRPIDFGDAVTAMIGRSLAAAHLHERDETGETVFELTNARLSPDSAAFALSLRQGEVVAITGPLGAGKSRLLNAIFGNGKLAAGAMRLGGGPYLPASPAVAIAAGIAFAGEDRHRSSMMPAGWPGASVAGTIALPHLGRWFPSGFLLRGKERAAAEAGIRRLGISTSGPDAPMETLSGGNQQKVVLARWQAEPAKLLLLDEPFQGVDVGARADIIAAIRADRRCATLIATSDPEEAFEVADRIFTLNRHELAPWRETAGTAADAPPAEVYAS